MSYRKKEQKLRRIAKLYLSFLSNHNYSNSKELFTSFQSAVEIAYSSLSAPLKKIINNDFFYQDYPGWWKLLYKRSNYQKLKNTAISKFLEAYYEF